jgi:hypothetical protein
VALVVVAALALHKPAAPVAQNDSADPNAQPGAQLVPTTAQAPLTPPPSVLAPVTPTAPAQSTPTATTSGATEVATNDVLDDATEPHAAHHRAHVAPFGNASVTHGNVLRLKMDGDIEKIEGDGLPTGFSVVLPGRRSLEPAAPLAARDSRIASIRVANDGSGAELTVAFKDGVPNYQVRAKGDELEIVLAAAGALGEQKPAHAAASSHHRHHRKQHSDGNGSN